MLTRGLIHWLFLLLAIPFLLTGVAMAVGAFLPREHVVSSTVFLACPPDSVWGVIADFPRVPEWRPEVERMEQLDDREGRAVWREVERTGPLTYEVVSWDPPRALALRIADPDLPFGGTWTYELTSERGGSRITVTERGTIKNPVFRFLARFAIGYHSTVDGYITALGRRLGKNVRPEHRAVPSTTG